MKILNYLLFGTEDRKLLNHIKDLKDESNYKFLVAVSAMCIFLLILPLVEIIFFEEFSYRFGIYCFFLGLIILIFLFAKFVTKKFPVLILPIFYILFITCLFYGGMLGIFTSLDYPAVTFNIFIFVYPLLIFDVPWRLDLVVLLGSSSYLYVCSILKSPEVFHIEFMNIVNSMLLSMIVSTMHQIQNVNNFSDRFILKHQRDTDGLSKTLSRTALDAEIKETLGTTGNQSGCFMFIDIDNFKNINDTYGHDVGDKFIAETGKAIKKVCRSTDILGRYGGDEFMVFFPNLFMRDKAEKKAKEIMLSVKTCEIAKTLNAKVSVSIGCLIFKTSEDLAYLFKEVDNLMYQAKQNGKDQFCIKEI